MRRDSSDPGEDGAKGKANPHVSIVIPAFNSERTIAQTLQSLRSQTFRNFEVIVVDSSPNDATSRIVRRFPEVLFVRSRTRLLPHAARDLGSQFVRGLIIVSTDPDTRAEPDWLERLMEAHFRTGGAISGAILSAGDNAVCYGMHNHKFGTWSARRKPGPVQVGPTANLLVTREQLDQVSGFQAPIMLGDTLLAWKLAAKGHTITLAPDAMVYHFHSSKIFAFILERYRRGREFSGIRVQYHRWPRERVLLWFLITLVPVRLSAALYRAVLQFEFASNKSVAWNIEGLFVSILGTLAHLSGELVGFMLHLNGKGITFSRS